MSNAKRIFKQTIITVKFELPIWLEIISAVAGIAVILAMVAVFWKLNLIQAY